MNPSIPLSIIIVNYNVRDFLVQCLNSIFNSRTNFLFEVIVVDNNSTDDSVEFLHKTFPMVNVIQLKTNYGFSYANNKGFEASKGKYLLFLNPDTVLQEDTLQTMYNFMEQTPNVGIAGCRVLNADGTLQLACRRGFPTPWVAFTKLFGLQKLFPKSKLFGRYNLTYLDPNEFSFVDSISGSFMFVRRELFAKLGGFDTSFFMYGEDLDLCYRAKKLGMEVAYVPTTSIVHYKGQSTIRSIIDNKYHFFKSMEIFSKKHFSNSKWFTFVIKLGIFLRQLLSKLFAYKVELAFIVSDLIVVNLSLLLATWLR
ncbi:MAG: glycosyltransferase family 2 protein, partial [Candidatus Kapaibacteriota bacterium]